MALKTMYPPQKDSPTTFLLGDISATDTLMTVASAASLPQVLPYPLTLGIDKTITETVMVTAQNLENNQLTITRGTPAYAWLSGSKAARVMTAKDVSDMQDNIKDVDSRLTTTQGTVTTQGTDISGLKTTVGGAGSGLVKGLADEIVRATTAEGAEVTRATAAEGNLNTIKINRSELAQVITDWVYSADGTKVEVNITRYNASTQQTTQYTRTLPVVTDDTMGVMTPEAYAEISALRTDVNALINLGGRFIGVSFATKAALNSYVVPATVKTGDFTYVLDDETHSGATTRYVQNGSTWDFTFVIDYDPIGLANSTTAGIVKSASTDGKVFVETDGTMSVVGWDVAVLATATAQNTANAAIPKSVATAADQVIVSTAAGTWGAKTKAQFKTWLASVAADISDFAATVRGVVLTGVVFTTNAAIVAGDSLLVALGKLQAQISTHKSRHASGGADALSPHDIGAVAKGVLTTQAEVDLITRVSGVYNVSGVDIIGNGDCFYFTLIHDLFTPVPTSATQTAIALQDGKLPRIYSRNCVAPSTWGSWFISPTKGVLSTAVEVNVINRPTGIYSVRDYDPIGLGYAYYTLIHNPDQGDPNYASQIIMVVQSGQSTTMYTRNCSGANTWAPWVTKLDSNNMPIESGTFTPTIQGDATAGNNSYSEQNGYYYKVGKLVFAHGKITMSAKDGAISGSIYIAGLPFTTKTVTNGYAGAIIPYYSGLANANLYSLGGYAGTQATKFVITQYQLNAFGTLTHANLTNTSSFSFSIVYETN